MHATKHESSWKVRAAARTVGKRTSGAAPSHTAAPRRALLRRVRCSALCAASSFAVAVVVLAPAFAGAATVMVSPGTVTLPIASSRTFTAAVSGLSSTQVTWEVNGQPGGNTQVGTISTAGLYVAPSQIATAPLTVTVTARAAQSSVTTGNAAVIVRYQVPWLTTVTPTTLFAGNPFTLDIAGSRFAPGAQAFLGQTPLATTWISDTKLRATGSLDPSQIGGLVFRVDNPGAVPSTPVSLVAVPPSGGGAVPADTLAAIRFLEQATFGPTDPLIAEVKALGFDNWLALQMNPQITPPSVVPDGLSVNAIAPEWVKQMTTAPDQLRQRVAFALSQLFVVSRWKNTNGEELSPWVRLLSANAFGNFRTLMQEVTTSPTMGKYLDLVNSRKPTANENYPRELMQLFTIGTWKLEQDGLASLDANGKLINTYDQNVVGQVAKAMTGWVYAPLPGKVTGPYNSPNFTAPMVAYEPGHDATAKTIFDGIAVPPGMTTAAETGFVLDKLFAHANVPPFVATRLIRSLVTSNPSTAYVKRVADVFSNNGQGVRGDLAAVVKQVLTDVEARQDSPAPDQGRLKDPIVHVLNVVRALGGQVVDPAMVMYLFQGLGEEPLAAQSVFSFYSPLAPLPKRPDLYGPEFQIYTPALAVQRANFLWTLITGQLSNAFTIDITPFVLAASDPVALVSLVDAKLFHGGMSLPLRQAILQDSYGLTDAKQRAQGALYIAATSSEYAVQR